MTELVGDGSDTPPFQLDNAMINLLFGLQSRGYAALRIIMGAKQFVVSSFMQCNALFTMYVEQ